MRITAAIVLLAGLSCFASPPKQYDSIAIMVAQKPISGETVLAETAAGLRAFKHVASITGTTNIGNTFASVGGGYWESLDKGAEKQDVRWFGASTNLADNAVQFQAAIDAAKAAGGNRRVFVPAGLWYVSSVRCDGVIIEGVNSWKYPDATAGTSIRQTVGATNHLIHILFDDTSDRSAVTGVRNLALYGSKNQNMLARAKTITAIDADSRTNFYVATGDVPSNPSDYSVGQRWPYFGHCFFYDTDNQQYVGFGIVRYADPGTGKISLLHNTDYYATATTNVLGTSGFSGRLNPGWKVVFSLDSTELSPITGTNTAICPADAGLNGIHITSQNLSLGFFGGVQIENVVSKNFHTGIRVGNVLLNNFVNVNTVANAFAGIAGALPVGSRDDYYTKCFLQGFAQTDYEQDVSPSYTNGVYRQSAYGFYNPSSAGSISDIVSDHTVIGGLVHLPVDLRIGSVLIDNPIAHGIEFAGQYRTNDIADVTFAQVVIRTPNDTSSYTVLTNERYALRSMNVGWYSNQVAIASLGVPLFGWTNGAFNALCSIEDPGRIQIGEVTGMQGVLGITTGIAGRPMPDLADYAIHYKRQLLVGQNGMHIGTQVNTNLFGRVDATTLYSRWGSDSGNTDTRTDLAQKDFRMVLPNATNAQRNVALVGGFANTSQGVLQLGGFDDSSVEPMTQMRFQMGTSKGGTERRAGLWSHIGLALSDYTDAPLTYRNSMFELWSTNRGFIPPRFSKANRDALFGYQDVTNAVLLSAYADPLANGLTFFQTNETEYGYHYYSPWRTNWVRLVTSGDSSINLSEVSTAPDAPATNSIVLYAVDNGSGKTQLVVMFSDGSTNAIATQP